MHHDLIWSKAGISTSSTVVAANAVLTSRVCLASAQETTLAHAATPKAPDVVASLGVSPALVQAGGGTGLAKISPCVIVSGPTVALVTNIAAASAFPACATDIVAGPLIAVKEYADAERIPYKYVLLDSWWYYKGKDGGVKEWLGRPDIFPHGNGYLRNTTGWPVTLGLCRIGI